MQENIIEQLYNEYSSHGFISEERIFGVLETNNISLLDSDSIIDALLSRGVIIRDDITNISDDNDNEEYDKGHCNYEEIYRSIIEVEPELDVLIDYVRSIPAPQHREWQVLLPQAQNGNAFARNRLFEMYMRSVLRIAFQFSQRYRQPLSDTIQNGFVGLFLSIDKFEFGRQDNFPQYYPLWVMQQIRRESESFNPTVYYPVHVKDESFAIFETVDNHWCEKCGKLDVCPNLLAEVQHILNCSDDDAVDAIKSLDPFVSYEEYFFDENGDFDEEHDLFNEDFNLYEIIEGNNVSAIIYKILETLTPREEQVIKLRYGLSDGREYTLEEVGKKYGITRERIRQIEAKALRKLRHPTRSKLLK